MVISVDAEKNIVKSYTMIKTKKIETAGTFLNIVRAIYLLYTRVKYSQWGRS